MSQPLHDFGKLAVKVSGCMECHLVTGEFDYFLLARTRFNDSFNRLHAEQLLRLPGGVMESWFFVAA